MKPGHGKKVVLAMSGGVDSSVAALLLLEQGYDIVGCFMRLGSEDSVEAPDAGLDAGLDTKLDSNLESACNTSSGVSNRQGCCSVNDADDARLVAAMLDIPFYVLNFKKDFGRIIDYFVSEYNAGRTPNPCVRCNDWLKFGKLHTYARSIDADFVATGHYARIEHASNTHQRARLMRGLDPKKDQSYVLFGAPLGRLEQMLLPVGDYHKPDIRRMAEEFGLPVFDKPDSYEICFVPDNDYAGLIKRQTPEAVGPGKLVDTAGNVVGEHAGHQHFTLGQRRGVGMALGYPIYVVDKNAADNTVTVGAKEDALTTRLTARETNWFIDPPRSPRDAPMPCQTKIRYNSPPQPARVVASGEDELEVIFETPQHAVTPGQAVVCYDGDTVLGGGWIATVSP